MLASMVSFAPQMFARQVAIFRGIYLEIEQSIGAWNREIDQIREKNTVEFPMSTSKGPLERVLDARRRLQAHDCARASSCELPARASRLRIWAGPPMRLCKMQGSVSISGRS